ncbi:DsbA family protein [Zunongwangia sp. F363]|uniref:DsbA family protein n=1 Tax=Autumnicola tepida TaxID=3075595 RepID=A0ABU3CBQ2_9FLAO|nr:DsbA family protein [Zunongwangia sp. F363]MDT0643773.1 DsbA family protein [Zunongwangia sp. F363]
MADKFYIEYYTDPLCCWSWGMEPQLRKLRYLLKGRLHYRYVMGGLLHDWQHFEDPMNNISRPAQMGPLWMEAKHTTGQHIDETVWLHNPVDTSYLACMAVKAAGMQSAVAGEAMLRELREAVMINKQNIGEKEVIFDTAGKLQEKNILDLQLFNKAMHSNEAADLFRKDLETLKIKGITRFPTLLISYGKRTVQITGFRPFDVLLDAFKALDPDLEINENINKEDYIQSWENLTRRELKEVQNLAVSSS